jgi:hypothetical protein
MHMHVVQYVRDYNVIRATVYPHPTDPDAEPIWFNIAGKGVPFYNVNGRYEAAKMTERISAILPQPTVLPHPTKPDEKPVWYDFDGKGKRPYYFTNGKFEPAKVNWEYKGPFANGYISEYASHEEARNAELEAEKAELEALRSKAAKLVQGPVVEPFKIAPVPRVYNFEGSMGPKVEIASGIYRVEASNGPIKVEPSKDVPVFPYRDGCAACDAYYKTKCPKIEPSKTSASEFDPFKAVREAYEQANKNFPDSSYSDPKLADAMVDYLYNAKLATRGPKVEPVKSVQASMLEEHKAVIEAYDRARGSKFDTYKFILEASKIASETSKGVLGER